MPRRYSFWSTIDADTNNKKDPIFIVNVAPTADASQEESELSLSISLEEITPNLKNNWSDIDSNHNSFKNSSGQASTTSLVDTSGGNKITKSETWLKMTPQMAIPLFLAGLGMTGAGLLLEEVLTWEVFVSITDLIFLVTPLLGLKGDLEMTLASRISTQANLGNMKSRGQIWKICFANLCLDQFQAIICGFLAALLAITMGVSFAGETFSYQNSILLCASSCTTASIVSLVLGSIMCTVIILSNKAHFNPDNIATPVAGSLGDVVTLGSLALVGSFLYANRDEYSWLPYIFLGVSILSLPFCGYVAYRSEFTKEILKTGWAPVLISVVISSGGGLILEQSSEKYTSLALYQPLINGIGGNMVCILASRLATQLHRDCEKKVLPEGFKSICVSPVTVFFGKGVNCTAARILMLLVCPLQLAFVTIIYFSSSEGLFNIKFLGLFEAASFFQLLILLYIARILANFCWRRGWDPDTSSIPYLTALGDLVGSSFLLVAFIIYEIL